MANKFVRGGCWLNGSGNLSSSSRFSCDPASKGNGNGFRVVKEVEPLFRVYRGGGWYDPAEYCRSAIRFGGISSSRYYNLGFRVVKGVTNGQ